MAIAERLRHHVMRIVLGTDRGPRGFQPIAEIIPDPTVEDPFPRFVPLHVLTSRATRMARVRPSAASCASGLPAVGCLTGAGPEPRADQNPLR